MAFKFISKVQIGKYTFDGGFEYLNIKKSIRIIMDTASIRIPALGKVIEKNKTLPSTSLSTAKLFEEGDKVKIELGYNGELKTEFEGFVRRVAPATPIIIEMEGYAWQLRRKNIMKSWKKVTLRAVLEEIVKGTDIVLSDKIPLVNLTNLGIHNLNGLSALEKLKDKVHLTAYFRGKVLYVGLEELNTGKTIKYKLGWSVLRDDGLKYRHAKDTRVKVRVTRKLKKGEQVLYEVGDADGAINTIKLPFINSATDIKKLGDEALIKAKYTGYEGKITTFLQPYAEPGDYAKLSDETAGERDGTYFIISTDAKYSTTGARRILDLGRKVSG